MPQTPTIEDTFAEAFPVSATRVIIPAPDAELVSAAAQEFCGNASSVIEGLSVTAVAKAMQAGLDAAAVSPGMVRITAGNYAGKLGPHHFHLHRLQEMMV